MTAAIVVGGGHNALTAAAYLARGGLDVTVLESRATLGGAAATEELIPGYRTSSCAFVLGLLRPRIIRDLQLTRHGLDLYQAPGVLGATIHEDGRHFFTYGELDRELAELRRHFGRRDAQAFVAFGAAMQRVGALLEPTLLSPPPSVAALQASFERAGAGALFDRFVRGSVADLLDGLFASPELKGYLAFPAMVSVFGGPSTPGTAYVLTHHSVSEFQGRFGQWGFVRGGMGSVSEAIASAARVHGATIRTGAPVERILVEDGAVAGVVLEGGEQLRAPLVVSGADPQRTLLGLVGAAHLPDELVGALRGYDVRGSMARVHIAVDALPAYAGMPARSGPGPEHLGHALLGADLGRYERAAAAQAAGELPEDFVLEVLIDTAREPGLAPPGRHMIITGVQQLPRELSGTDWDAAKAEFTRRVIAQLARFAPGFEDHVLATHTLTPLDLEREYGLPGGNIYHGAMGIGQLLDRRPLPALGHYRTPVAGLYLCGSGTHPGGGVMGASGHNAAHAVLGDLAGAPPAAPVLDGRPRGALARLGVAASQSRTLQRIAVASAGNRLTAPLLRRATAPPKERL